MLLKAAAIFFCYDSYLAIKLIYKNKALKIKMQKL